MCIIKQDSLINHLSKYWINLSDLQILLKHLNIYESTFVLMKIPDHLKRKWLGTFCTLHCLAKHNEQ